MADLPHVRSSFFWSFFQSVGAKVFSFLAFIIIVRELSPEDFGLVAFAVIFIEFSRIFVEAGFAQALIRHERLTDLHTTSVFWFNLLIGLVATGVLFLMAPFIAVAFSSPNLVEPLRAISCGLLINSLSSVQVALLQRDMEFKKMAMRGMSATFISGGVGIYTALAGYGVWALIFQSLSGALVGTIMVWRIANWRPRFVFSPRAISELFVFGRGVLGTNLLTQLNRKSDDLLIGAFLGSVSLGIYSVGFKVFKLLDDVVNGSVRRVIFPRYSRLSSKPEKLREMYYPWLQMSFTLLAPLYISLAVIAPDLIPFLFGEQWLEAVPVSQCLMLVLVAVSINMNNTTVIMAMGFSGFLFRINLLFTIVMIASFFMVVEHGLLAVTLVFVARNYLLALPILIFALRQRLGISLIKVFSSLLAPFLALLMMAVSGFYFRLLIQSLQCHVVINIFISAVVMALVYLVSIFVIDRSIITGLYNSIKGTRSK